MDKSKIIYAPKEIFCMKSDNDSLITKTALNEFCDNLDAKEIDILNGGHFNSSAGFDEFSQLLQIIKK